MGASTSLTHDQDEIRVWWPKLARRPAEAVRRVSREIREASPEQRQLIVTRFAKEVKAIEKRESA